METIEHLRELYVYNDWANRRTVAALKSAESEKSLKILAHLLITEQEYYERLYGKDSTGFDFWKDLSVEDCGNLAQENAEKYENLLKRFDDEGLGQTVSYKTSEKTVPAFTSELTTSWPLCCCRIWRDRLNPMPDPVFLVV